MKNNLTFQIIVLIALVLAIGISAFTTLNKFTQSSSEFSTVHQETLALDQKARTLTRFKGENLNEVGIDALSALPSSVPLVGLLAKTRTFAQEESVLIQDVRVNGTRQAISDTGLNSVDFEITVTGNYQGLLNFANKMNQSSPMSTIQNIKIDGKEPARGVFNITGYYGDLPKNLPSITEAIPPLSQDEEDILNKLKLLVKPFVAVDVAPQLGLGRLDPFSQ